MENKTFDTAKIFRLEEAVEYSANGIVSKRIIDKGTGNISLFSFDEGQRLSEHTAPFDAFIQIIEGKAEIRIDGEPYNLNGGDSIILPAGKPHAVLAISKFKMTLTMIRA